MDATCFNFIHWIQNPSTVKQKKTKKIQLKCTKQQNNMQTHGRCVKTQLKHNIKYEAEITEENIENIKFTNILKAASGVKIMHLQN